MSIRSDHYRPSRKPNLWKSALTHERTLVASAAFGKMRDEAAVLSSILGVCSLALVIEQLTHTRRLLDAETIYQVFLLRFPDVRRDRTIRARAIGKVGSADFLRQMLPLRKAKGFSASTLISELSGGTD